MAAVRRVRPFINHLFSGAITLFSACFGSPLQPASGGLVLRMSPQLQNVPVHWYGVVWYGHHYQEFWDSQQNMNWINARYEDVFAHIAEGIQNGDYAPGERLTGERKLADALGMSRETVRQGLELAEKSGLIVRVPKRGTFVASPRVDQELGVMKSFRQTMRAMDMQPTYTLNQVDEVAMDPEAAAQLQVEEGSGGIVVEVLGRANGLPMSLYRSTLPAWVVEVLGQDVSWGDRASYELAAQALGCPSLKATQRFEAVSLQSQLAQVLRVRSGTPGFKTVSLFRTPDGRPIEARSAWYPGSRYSFSATRTIDIDL